MNKRGNMESSINTPAIKIIPSAGINAQSHVPKGTKITFARVINTAIVWNMVIRSLLMSIIRENKLTKIKPPTIIKII